MGIDDLELRSLPVGHLPVVRSCLDKLGAFATLEAHLPRHVLAHASNTERLAVMVLDILSGRPSRQSEHALDVLQLLRFDEEVFSRPPPQRELESAAG